jgi:hypothetical protein
VSHAVGKKEIRKKYFKLSKIGKSKIVRKKREHFIQVNLLSSKINSVSNVNP